MRLVRFRRESVRRGDLVQNGFENPVTATLIRTGGFIDFSFFFFFFFLFFGASLKSRIDSSRSLASSKGTYRSVNHQF